MNRRVIAILLMVVGITLLLGIGGLAYISSQDTPVRATSAPPLNEQGTPLPVTPADDLGAPPPGLSDVSGTPVETLEVVVSLQTVPRGWRMTAAELTTEFRVAGEVGSNVMISVDDVIGKYARTDIFQGQTVTRDLLADDFTEVGTQDYGPSSLIPQGFIAASVPLDRLSGVAYGLAPGDYIDIMITFRFYQIDEEFQTYLRNAGIFFLSAPVEEGGEELPPSIFSLSPLGRFEQLATGELTHITPSEDQRPLPVSMILQNARVIQVGSWVPTQGVSVPTPTPPPAEGEATPTPSPEQIPTSTPTPPDVLLVALSPQQQLFLKYAVESGASIDFALRGVNDGQLYSIENVDLNYLLQRYNFEIPPNVDYSVDSPSVPVTVTPSTSDTGGGG